MASESQFGFKDKAKAVETLELLEKHELQYRKLTVRGLLGRAKRVLTMTKAEEKIKNIKEAMVVFENWLEENGGNQSNKNAKTDSDEKVETVPGLGFKDKQAAEKTLQILKGRDPDYQKLAIRGLIGSSKRVLSGTKNDDKIKAIKEGVSILEDFLEIFDRENRSKLNLAYLPIKTIIELPKVSGTNKLANDFLKTYQDKAKGNYKHLRTIISSDSNESWDIVRNKELAKIKEKISKENIKLFDNNGAPTNEHLNMIYWAYSPQPDKLKSYLDKKNISSSSAKGNDTKRKSTAAGPSSSSEDEDTPKKKQKSK